MFKQVNKVFATYDSNGKAEIIEDEIFLSNNKFKNMGYNLDYIFIIAPDYINADGY